MKTIKGAEPDFKTKRKEILNKIDKILESGELTSGKYIKDFEKMACKMANTKYAISVNSGGTALELALKSLKLNGKEVILPSQTFIASANAIVRAGGIPVFCDIQKEKASYFNIWVNV